MPSDLASIIFPALRIEQPIGTFYSAVVDSKDLVKVCYFDVRRMERRDVEKVVGIERPLNQKRVTELRNFVSTVDATYPTSIVVAVDEATVDYDEDTRQMTLHEFTGDQSQEPIPLDRVARVLDGQHRLDSLTDPIVERFDVPVSIFVSLDLADQGYVFATINLGQTKVNRSLAYDLFALGATASPYKTCHDVALALDRDVKSPLHERIKRLGSATPGRYSETLTLATVVQSLIALTSDDPRSDRDIALRGRRLKLADQQTLMRLPFRNMFIEGKESAIARVVWNLFEAVASRWPKAWKDMGRGTMLNKTNGFRALMRYLRPAYLHLAKPGDPVSSERFLNLLSRSDLKDDDFDIERYRPGASGESRLFHELVSQTGLEQST